MDLKNFIPEDWNPETSSGYAGYRNTVTQDWIYKSDYDKMCTLLEKAEADDLETLKSIQIELFKVTDVYDNKHITEEQFRTEVFMHLQKIPTRYLTNVIIDSILGEYFE